MTNSSATMEENVSDLVGNVMETMIVVTTATKKIVEEVS